jgi:hypothetical protein
MSVVFADAFYFVASFSHAFCASLLNIDWILMEALVSRRKRNGVLFSPQQIEN